MLQADRHRNARTYAIYGAVFGLIFPALSTVMYAVNDLGGVGEVVHAQQSSALLWIIDTAPAFLGMFAWLAGRRQDAVEELVGKVTATSEVLEHTNQQLAAKNDALGAANSALVEAGRLKSQFLANMSHELRTPLNAIIGFSRIVLKKTEALIPERQAKNLQTIHDSGRHLLELVNDLLDIERIEAGMLRVTFARVELGPLVADVIRTLNPAAMEKSLVLEFDPSSEPVWIRSDPIRLRQILDNLVNNAIKYSDRGTIHVGLARGADGEIRIDVVDQGMGIPHDHLDRIFEAFHQVDGSSTRAQGGVGLGLHLVRRLVELLEGKLAVASEVGEGSTFTVTFPASLVDGARVAATPNPSALEAAGAGPIVLVIDDQVEAIDILRAELVDAGFRVEAALSGEEGLAKAIAVRPSAILLDMVMQGMDGWGVLKRLRSDPELSTIPVIITSMLDDTPHAWDLGIVAWLTKPVAPQDFLAVFERVGIGVAADILVVEDDPPTRELLVEQLLEYGLSPRTAIDGAAAIAAIDLQLPRGVVLDLMLPGLDGFQVLEHLRTPRDGRAIPVIVYTARELTLDERQRLNGGVVDVIRKGAGNHREVVQCLRRAVDSPPRPAGVST